MNPPPSTETLRNDTELRNLTAELRRSPDLRSRWGQNKALWENVVQVLERSDQSVSVPVILLQFLNNLTASNGIGVPALSTGFLRSFSRAAIGTETTVRRLYWQILANFISSFANKGSGDLDQAIEHICSDLPFAEAITNDSEAVAYPCLVFIYSANNLITSVKTKIKLNIDSGALGYLLDVLPLWFEGGEEKDQCIKLAKCIFESSVTSGAFAALMKEFQYNDSRELTLFSMLDAVITSSSFNDPTKKSRFVHTDSGKADMAAICTRLEYSIDVVMELIMNEQRTAEESFIAGQRVLKLLDILITLLSAVHTKERQNQRYLLPSLVQLLQAAKTIPSISKLGDARSFEDLPLDDRSFPHLKTYLLMLLAVLVEDDFSTQEQLRTSGGLALILECCVIDGNNPFMKERAIVCLRYLLKGNDENQQFVASLEARQVADPDTLSQAGYEASVVNGKISLKPRPK